MVNDRSVCLIEYATVHARIIFEFYFIFYYIYSRDGGLRDKEGGMFSKAGVWEARSASENSGVR